MMKTVPDWMCGLCANAYGEMGPSFRKYLVWRWTGKRLHAYGHYDNYQIGGYPHCGMREAVLPKLELVQPERAEGELNPAEWLASLGET